MSVGQGNSVCARDVLHDEQYNVLISHLSQDDNKGDFAILEGMVALLRGHWPYLTLNFHSVEAFGETAISLRFTRMFNPKSITATVLPPIHKSMLQAFGRLLISPICLVYPPIVSWLAPSFFSILTDSRRIVCKGGSYLFSRGTFRENLYLYRMLFPLLLANRLGKPFALLGVSIGPIENPLLRKVTTYVLAKASFIAVREELSLEYIRKVLGLTTQRIYKIPDLAFFPDHVDSSVIDKLIEKQPRFSEGPVFGVTARHWRTFNNNGNPETFFRAYITAIVECAKSLVSKGWRCLLIAQSLEDVPVLRKIYDELSSIDANAQEVVAIIDEDVTSAQLRGVYEKLIFLIGTRMHSVILAASVGTPSIAIAYERNKTIGIMKDLGMEDFVCLFENCVTLQRKVQLLLENSQTLRKHLMQHVGLFRNQLHEFSRTTITGFLEVSKV